MPVSDAAKDEHEVAVPAAVDVTQAVTAPSIIAIAIALALTFEVADKHCESRRRAKFQTDAR
jgi:hypothetical protein